MRRGSWLVLAAVSLWCAAVTGSTCNGQEVPCWGSRGGGTYVPDATGQPSPTPYITTQGGVHMHLPRHPKPPCQRPTSICIKPKVWKFSQAFYQLHHEVWHGVTDPCWLMDPDCCGTSCQHQKSFGLIDLFPWARRNDCGCRGATSPCRGATSPCQQCGGVDCQQGAPAGCDDGQEEGTGTEFEGEQISPTPADPPVEHPQAAQRGPLRSVLLRRE